MSHNGYLTVYVYKYCYTPIEVASLMTEYYHQKFAIDGSISFSPSPSINLTYSNNYNKYGSTYKSWEYGVNV